MAGKVSTAVALLCLALVLGILIAASEGSRRKGKFMTPGGSHCRWMERKKHNDTDVRYTLKCRCHSKAGGVMRYRCTYQTSFHGRGQNSLQLSDSFLQIIKGNIAFIFTDTIMVPVNYLRTVVVQFCCTSLLKDFVRHNHLVNKELG